MSKSACLQCTHALSAHQDASTGKVVACRVTRCTCATYVEPPTKTPPGAGRRVCVEVPPGYAVTVQLVPLHPGEMVLPPESAAALEEAD